METLILSVRAGAISFTITDYFFKMNLLYIVWVINFISIHGHSFFLPWVYVWLLPETLFIRKQQSKSNIRKPVTITPFKFDLSCTWTANKYLSILWYFYIGFATPFMRINAPISAMLNERLKSLLFRLLSIFINLHRHRH